MKNKNKTLALFGLIGAVLYAIVAGLVILPFFSGLAR